MGLQVGNLQHLQPAMQATNNKVEANMTHLGAVGWQHEPSSGCRLATYSIYSQQWTLKTAWVGANMTHLGAVGWQPTAFTASNAGYKQQGWGQHEASWGCRLATYSIYSQQCGLQTARVGPTWSILGLQVGNLQHLQPAMRATNNMGGANTRHLGAVGWQPTALQPAMRATNSRGGADMRHLGAVGLQPTAFTASNGP